MRDKTCGVSSDPLADSFRIQDQVSAKGFDWPDISGVFDKVTEEVDEIHEALNAGDPDHAKRELGDLLFAIVNLSRFLQADPSEELHRANERFSARFLQLEEQLELRGIAMGNCTLEQLDVVWEEVKRGMRE